MQSKGSRGHAQLNELAGRPETRVCSHKILLKLWHIDDKDLWHHKDSLLSLNGYDLCL